MSLITFTLKEEHLKLLKHLNWSLKENFITHLDASEPAPLIVNIGGEDNEDMVPFGLNTLFEGIDLVLKGKEDGVDLLNKEEFAVYPEEQKKEWLDLYNELPTALEIILQTQGFILGTYTSKFHFRNWKLVNK